MKYYSEKLNKIFNSVEELEKAEANVKSTKDLKKIILEKEKQKDKLYADAYNKFYSEYDAIVSEANNKIESIEKRHNALKEELVEKIKESENNYVRETNRIEKEVKDKREELFKKYFGEVDKLDSEIKELKSQLSQDSRSSSINDIMDLFNKYLKSF